MKKYLIIPIMCTIFNNCTFGAEPMNIAPQNFNWNELTNLRDDIPVKRLQGDLVLTMQLKDSEELKKAWPSRLQVLSRQTFESRISKQSEIHVESKEGVCKTLSTYEIQKDTLGYGPYTFQVICELAEEIDEFELMSSEILSSTVEKEETDDDAQEKSTQGLRLKPAQLRSNLFSYIADTKEWQKSDGTYEFAYKSVALYQVAQDNNQTHVVFSPVHDLSEGFAPADHVKCGGLSLAGAVKVIGEDKNFAESNMSVYIPVAQSNGSRRHWTLLYLNKEEGAWSITHLDPKGILSSIYGLAHIKETLSVLRGQLLSDRYLGHQGLKNNEDCGRFVIRYINYLSQGIDPAGISFDEITKDFDRF